MNTSARTIKYISFYSIDNGENRYSNLACKNKVEYICDALLRSNHKVELISPSWTNNISGYYKGKSIYLRENLSLRTFATFGTNIKLLKYIKYKFSIIQLLIYLILSVKKDDKVIAYHSPSLCNVLRISKFIKKFELILELEEIYSEVWKTAKKLRAELRIINNSDKLIVVSDVLRERFFNKECIVLYGSYRTYLSPLRRNEKSDLIRIVYAGSIDKVKGGAFKAIECMRYLSKSYQMNILGYGFKSDVEDLIKKLEEINAQKGYDCCIYHGTKTGASFLDILVDCDIAINPQKQGDYMDTAFPSKILTYLSNNLRVVSTKIKSIVKSELAEYINFSEDDSEESIAEAIKRVDFSREVDGKNKIIELDELFTREITNFLGI